MSFLRNHPFAVAAFFEESLVLSFAVPKDELKPLIPSGVELDIFDDKWGFVAMALVQTNGLRPKGFPKIFGQKFTLVGYRIFVRYENLQGRKLRGLYILKSETNKKSMNILGGIFTRYNYTFTDIKINQASDARRYHSTKSNFDIEIYQNFEAVNLPKNSPFPDWKTARRYAGPLPFTFTKLSKENKMLIVEGVRSDWKPIPVNVLTSRVAFIDQLNINGMVLASAFVVRQVPYYWKAGILEKLTI